MDKMGYQGESGMSGISGMSGMKRTRWVRGRLVFILFSESLTSLGEVPRCAPPLSAYEDRMLA